MHTALRLNKIFHLASIHAMLLFLVSFVDESVLKCVGNSNYNTVICPNCPEGKRHDAHAHDEFNYLPMIEMACVNCY